MRVFTFLLILGFCFPGHSQEDILFTRGFTKKIKRAGIEFFSPVESWLQPTNKKKDEFMKYDIILRSDRDYEMRFAIKRDKKSHIQHPHIEATRILTTIASNDENDLIEIELLDPDNIENEYGADWGIKANFQPKENYTGYKNGRLFSLYKGGQALASCIILYNEELTPYLEKPFIFK